MLGLRTGNQHRRRDAELAPVELLPVRDVLRRLAFEPFVQVTPEVDPADAAQFVVAVRVQVGAVLLQGMREENLGGEPGEGTLSSSRSFVP